MPSRRLIHLLPLAVFAVVVAYFLAALWSGRDPALVPSALIDKPAPAFDLPGLSDGEPGFARADLDGAVSLVNFFASWCVPCRAEHPILMRLAREEGVRLFGVAYKDKPEAARAFLAELGNPFTRVGVDPTGRTSIEFGVYGVPESYVIDRGGHVRMRHVGAIVPAVLEKDILPLIEDLRR
jgi:cytochrome c biogenesis protein CcmG/thiol:disulfide interchange protein DsbE